MARSAFPKHCITVFFVILIPNFISASDYKFKVYATEACPNDQIEMDERSLALNCTKSNGYTCLPNENISVLLEFCYKRPRIAVTKGLCLFLRHSDVDVFDCRRFESGCPDVDYYSDELYNYPNCASITSGCFLADASCKRMSESSTKESNVTTFSKDLDKITGIRDWNSIIIYIRLLISILSCFCLVCVVYTKGKSLKTVIESRSPV